MAGLWANCIVIVAFALSATNARAFEFFQPVQPPRDVQVMVHRGMAVRAPENTQPALESLVEDYLEWAEVDVRLTADDRHVLFHDSDLDDKTDGAGQLAKTTLAELQALDAGGWFASRFAGERLLTLKECLELCRGRLNLYLDCKQIDPAILVTEVLDAGMERQVVVFDEVEVLRRVRDLSGGRIAIMPKWNPELAIEAFVDDFHPDVVEIDVDVVSCEVCEAFHARGVEVQAKVLGEWDAEEYWERGWEAGVDYFQTDRPGELLAHALQRRLPQRPVQFSAHRGALRYAPENTFPAFETARALGADYIEIDIRTTRDGGPFLLHDAALDRTTNGRGLISRATAAEVRSLDAGAWFGRLFRREQVPPFEDFLARFAGKVGLYCDAKEIQPSELARLLEKYDAVDSSVVYQGRRYLAELQHINPSIRRLPPVGSDDDRKLALDSLRPYGYDAAWRVLSLEFVARAHADGVLVFSDAMGEHETVDDYLEAISWGVDVIQTNHPVRLLRAMELHAAQRTGD